MASESVVSSPDPLPAPLEKWREKKNVLDFFFTRFLFTYVSRGSGHETSESADGVYAPVRGHHIYKVHM